MKFGKFGAGLAVAALANSVLFTSAQNLNVVLGNEGEPQVVQIEAGPIEVEVSVLTTNARSLRIGVPDELNVNGCSLVASTNIGQDIDVTGVQGVNDIKFTFTFEAGTNAFPDSGNFMITTNDDQDCLGNNGLGPLFKPFLILTDAPTESPTSSPTTSPVVTPTEAPTFAPVPEIDSKIIWSNKPEQKFATESFVTFGEKLTIQLSLLDGEAVDIVEVANKALMDGCDVTDPIGTFTSDYVVEFGEATRYFTTSSEELCQAGLKLTTRFIARDDQFLVDWRIPKDADNLNAGEPPKFIRKGQPVNFVISASQTHNLIQFKTKAGFDACDLTDARIVNTFEGIDENAQLLVRDVFANDENDANDILWFGCSKRNEEGDLHCSLGQKVTLNVVADDFDPNADDENDEDDNTGAGAGIDPLVIGLAGGIGAVMLISIVVIVSLWRRRRGSMPRVSEKSLIQKREFATNDDDDIDVARSPASRSMKDMVPELSPEPALPPQNTSISLAKNKALESGLNF